MHGKKFIPLLLWMSLCLPMGAEESPDRSSSLSDWRDQNGQPIPPEAAVKLSELAVLGGEALRNPIPFLTGGPADRVCIRVISPDHSVALRVLNLEAHRFLLSAEAGAVIELRSCRASDAPRLFPEARPCCGRP